jgi:hypothetical protein
MVKRPCERGVPKLSPKDADIIVKLSVFNSSAEINSISSEHIMVGPEYVLETVACQP